MWTHIHYSWNYFQMRLLCPDIAVEQQLSIRDLRPNWKFIHGKTHQMDAMIKATHACIDNSGLFYPVFPGAPPISNPPRLFMLASESTMDAFFQLPSRQIQDVNVTLFKKKPLFVIGLVWPFHLSHWFQNNYMPLLNVMNNIYSRDTWMTMEKDLFIANSNKSFMFDAASLNFHNIFDDRSRSFGDDRIWCYENVIVGLNFTCDCCGCMKDFPHDKRVYSQMRRLVLSHHLSPNLLSKAEQIIQTPVNKRKFHLVIIQRLLSRRILNLDQVQSLLSKYNVSHQIVHLESVSFPKQVELFSINATAIMGVHGNALGNAFWLPPGSLVIEIHQFGESSAWYQHIFSDMNSGSLGHSIRHVNITCQDSACADPSQSGFASNVAVPLDKLETILLENKKLGLILYSNPVLQYLWENQSASTPNRITMKVDRTEAGTFPASDRTMFPSLLFGVCWVSGIGNGAATKDGAGAVGVV